MLPTVVGFERGPSGIARVVVWRMLRKSGRYNVIMMPVGEIVVAISQSYYPSHLVFYRKIVYILFIESFRTVAVLGHFAIAMIMCWRLRLSYLYKYLLRVMGALNQPSLLDHQANLSASFTGEISHDLNKCRRRQRSRFFTRSMSSFILLPSLH